ncbi:hypothetical protein A0J61_11493 [Choanephora cucurbitarum]|uniref:Uncharacterized protein n=1 Tax=Choanephora cucurbitarum TaxID=101091 RepID=A0A1C7MUM5_9FUNG|nr:hypothetical protein A0J61_11493 [Choanephora cucurbitarum]
MLAQPLLLNRLLISNLVRLLGPLPFLVHPLSVSALHRPRLLAQLLKKNDLHHLY